MSEPVTMESLVFNRYVTALMSGRPEVRQAAHVFNDLLTEHWASRHPEADGDAEAEFSEALYEEASEAAQSRYEREMVDF
jgi:hypothetical protein